MLGQINYHTARHTNLLTAHYLQRYEHHNRQCGKNTFPNTSNVGGRVGVAAGGWVGSLHVACNSHPVVHILVCHRTTFMYKSTILLFICTKRGEGELLRAWKGTCMHCDATLVHTLCSFKFLATWFSFVNFSLCKHPSRDESAGENSYTESKSISHQ